ncbi:MAG: helix-turn-helix domain-containing protein [Microbacterium arborescens]
MTTLDDIRGSSRATITRREAAEVLQVDPRTVTEAIKQGNIPALQIGRRIVIPRARFIAMFDATVADAS